MTKRELLKLLKKAGWELVREGKHEVWGKDDGLARSPLR